MPRKKVVITEEASLLPDIKQEEQRLEQVLHQARTQAETMVRDAERDAAERVKKARVEIPDRTNAEHAQALARLEAEAARTRPPAGEVERAVSVKAAANLRAAVDHIVSAVWPGERS
jgi:F0F1-type ATP synthase membrane subunit b/b'